MFWRDNYLNLNGCGRDLRGGHSNNKNGHSMIQHRKQGETTSQVVLETTTTEATNTTTPTTATTTTTDMATTKDYINR